MTRATELKCNGINDYRSLKSILSSSNEVHLKKRLPSVEYESDALRVIFKSAKSDAKWSELRDWNGDVIYFCVCVCLREENLNRNDISDLESSKYSIGGNQLSSRAMHFIGVKVSRIIECSMLSTCLEDIREIYIKEKESITKRHFSKRHKFP